MDRKILHRFFEGMASFEEEKDVCDWAEASDENRKELIKERKYYDAVLLHRLQERIKSRTNRRFSLPTLAKDSLKVAATLAILLVSGLYLYNYWLETEQIVAFNKVIVPPGQRVNIVLSDGTNVWLNACSEMTYPASFSEDLRTVHLKGEGYFEVTKEEERPFVVQTNRCDVKVLGTKFNVTADEHTHSFSAALMEGSIQLSDRTKHHPDILLSPNLKADWIDGKFVIDSISNFDDYRWKEGLICFENIVFSDLMKRFEKTYDIRIIVNNKKLDQYKCSGKFRIADGVDFILQVLQRSVRFSFARNEENTVIYIK